MPVNVFEDSIDLHIDLLTEDGYTAESWPYPRLKKTGEAESRRFRTVILENEYLRLTFIPALGGRLWEMFDKRCGSDRLCGEYNTARVEEKGTRNAEIWRGILLSVGDNHPKSALANTDCTFTQPADEADPGSILIASFSPDFWSTKYTLHPNSANIQVEVTTQNRQTASAPYAISTVWIEDSSHDTTPTESQFISSTFALTYEPGTFEDPNVGSFEDWTGLRRANQSTQLAPRQADAFSFTIHPHFSVSYSSWVGDQGVAELYVPRRPSETDKPGLFFCAAQPILGAKLLVSNEQGQVFEAPVDIHPEKVHYSDLSGIPGQVATVQLRDSAGATIATVKPKEKNAEPLTSPQTPRSKLEPHNLRLFSDATLLNLTSDPILRVPAYLELAARATERGDFQRADTCYEYALLFNGDDPLAWWAKAVNRRIGNLGTEGEECTELLNAHYLSPLEPCLRAESFLSQPRNHGKDPSPLLEPLNDCPENFIEVACQLIQARFYEEAAYFIDEALRHQNLAILHYLQAWLLTRKGGMEVEVAHRILLAAKAQLPPMPYRDIEREILTKLVENQKLPEPIMDWLSGQLPE